MFAKGFRTGLVPNWYVILLKLHDWAVEVDLHLPLDSEVFKQGQNLRAKIILKSYFLLGILIFKGLTARRLYKSFGVKGSKQNKHIGAL
jgi:hypothetical protein